MIIFNDIPFKSPDDMVRCSCGSSFSYKVMFNTFKSVTLCPHCLIPIREECLEKYFNAMKREDDKKLRQWCE